MLGLCDGICPTRLCRETGIISDCELYVKHVRYVFIDFKFSDAPILKSGLFNMASDLPIVRFKKLIMLLREGCSLRLARNGVSIDVVWSAKKRAPEFCAVHFSVGGNSGANC